MIVRGRSLTKPFHRRCDVVVVGTGAGGSMCARELARAGRDVVALEMGGFHRPSEFTQREDEMLPILFQERAARATKDMSVTVLQGRGVGGSTVHNTNLCKRTPDAVLDEWARRLGVSGWSPGEVAADFAATESELSVSVLGEAQLNAANRIMKSGTEALGWKGGFLSHNRVGCVGSGFCELGCAFNAKQNALKVVIPAGLAAGLDVYSDCEVTAVKVERGRAVGVRGRYVDADGQPRGEFEVSADAVVLAGSAVGSAALMLRSGLPDPHAQAGRHLHLHPGAPVAGVYDEPVLGWKGIPQSWEVMEFLDFERDDKRVWIVGNFAHPIGTATNLPGFGPEHARLMGRYAHLVVFTPMLHDRTEGRVTVTRRGRIQLQYTLGASDREQMALGLRESARLHLAAGAKRVVVPFVEPLEVTSERDLGLIRAENLGPLELPVLAVHPMSAARMSGSARDGVVRPDGRHHQLESLYVADGGLFPTSIGVPPQISIYTAGRIVARHLDTALPRASS